MSKPRKFSTLASGHYARRSTNDANTGVTHRELPLRLIVWSLYYPPYWRLHLPGGESCSNGLRLPCPRTGGIVRPGLQESATRKRWQRVNSLPAISFAENLTATASRLPRLLTARQFPDSGSFVKSPFGIQPCFWPISVATRFKSSNCCCSCHGAGPELLRWSSNKQTSTCTSWAGSLMAVLNQLPSGSGWNDQKSHEQ